MTPATRETAAESLNDLLAKAVEHVKAMTPEEREAMHEQQKKAWVAAEMAIGDEETRVVTGHRETADMYKNPAKANTSAKHVKTADHAELAALIQNLRASRTVWDNARARPKEIETRAADYIETLLYEIAALRGLLDERDLEIAEDDAAMRDLDAQIEDANDRATQAERQRDEARAVLIDIRDAPYTEQEWPRSRALNFLANQGADQ